MSTSNKQSPRRRESSTVSPRSSPSDADDERNELEIDDLVVHGEIHWSREVSVFLAESVYTPIGQLHASTYSETTCAEIAARIDSVLAMSLQFAFTPDGKNLCLMRYILCVLLPSSKNSKRRVKRLHDALRRLVAAQNMVLP